MKINRIGEEIFCYGAKVADITAQPGTSGYYDFVDFIDNAEHEIEALKKSNEDNDDE